MLILASSSAARRQLLASVGLVPDKVVYPEIDECIRKNEEPLKYVKRMAFEKSATEKIDPMDILIAADTIVVAGNRVLFKSSDEDEASNHPHS